MADTPPRADPRTLQAVPLASEARMDAALAGGPMEASRLQREAESLEALGRHAEATAAFESALRAWVKEGALLRAAAAWVSLRRLGGDAARTARVVAERFALPPGSAPSEPGLVPDASAASAVPILSWLDREAFVALLEALEVRAFTPGRAVVTEGAAGDSMFALVDGTAEVARALEGGERKVVGTVSAGDFFGELALVSEGPRLASVVATSRAVLLELTRARMEAAAVRHPTVATAVQTFFRRRLVENLLRSSPLLSPLSPAQKQAVAREFDLRAVPARQVLLTQGQPGDAFYLLLRGQCRPYLEQASGKKVALPDLREGDVFGEISLLLDKPVSATVRTESECVLLRLDRGAFERHILSQPGMKGMLMRMGTERLQRTARLLSGRELLEGDLRV
ncbi:cyclic nucleotide-binding protein [Corallococcus sp. H22C18031201]|uniref:cyclic nucleotide-binding domain-containing protein n=1 Tax=Citreicoccus inhibens TaxID=2849499 RepID=UPI000E718D4D|nr:cyclic nucleotide-binding domain-containing protein [Citreicoccus inhibens]MBU8900159.1 cyclic nucleotide-binding domain-containing protein [Citreicoccus inhibens]RJS21796.1 cyclic nucleotide-binding protein [Corallococcus sp. H22C18031201]